MKQKTFAMITIPMMFLLVIACVSTPLNTPASKGETPVDTPTEIIIEQNNPSTETPTPTFVPTDTPTPQPTATISLSPIIDRTNVDRLVEIGKIFQPYPNKVYWTDEYQNFVVQSQNQIVLYDSKTFVSKATFATLENTFLLGFSPKDKYIAVTNDQQTIDIWDLMTNEKIYSIKAPGMFTAAYFTPDGWLAVDLIDEIGVDLLNPQTGEVVQSYRGFQTAAPVYSTSFSRDNKWLLWLSRGTLQITDLQSSQLGPSFGHEDFINSYVLSPDGTILVTSAGGTMDDEFQPLLYFWDTSNGETITKIATSAMAYGLDFSYQGDLLSGGVGKTVIIWDSSNQEQRLVLEGFNDNVNFTTFSPDGRIFAATSFDNSVRFWQVNP